MKKRSSSVTLAMLSLLLLPSFLMAAAITEFDSTQPRGFAEGRCSPGGYILNEQGLDLCPADDGFGAPQRVGESGTYRDWAGSIMANAARDPSFFATVSVSNKDFLNFLYAAASKGLDTDNPELHDLIGLSTAREAVCALKLYDPSYGNPCRPGGDIRLLPEDQLPEAADICLRCHTPVGWMEGSSEPATPHFPYLKGQFWGAAFLETPVDGQGNPRLMDPSIESEAEMEGVQCDFCHRAKQNPVRMRQSRFDGTAMAAGGGSFFMDRFNSIGNRHHLRYGTVIPESTSNLFGEPGAKFVCWSCHQWECQLFGCDIRAIRECSYCHTQVDVQLPRDPRYVPFCKTYDAGGACVERSYDVRNERYFCGSCHDVTNPVIYTRTPGADRMLHPIERTYTEWFWSGYRDQTSCEDCHDPMKFKGAQTWMIYPGLDSMWGEVDRPWSMPPFNYPVNPSRTQAYMEAMHRNREFMQQEAADITFMNAPASVSAGGDVTVSVKVTNKTGHKLPSGFAEGRQMWIHIRAVDGAGTLLFESGYVLGDGSLARKEYFEAAQGGTVADPVRSMIKVYEQLVLAEGYKNFKLGGYSILDADRDGTVTHKEEEYHFVLMNYIEKDNRIPPMGFNRAAYMKDGAFIIPYDPKDTDYPSGQNWDVTPYSFTVPLSAAGSMTVTATLKYQTFNKEYIDFLKEEDTEKTEKFGGRARNLPDGPYENHETWGSAIADLWAAADKGMPVILGTASVEIPIQ
ncbi:MAG: hypothetical protein JSU90_04930 [Nitrospiraceae bacterium]|nr:MAG: hypothetical protein JSU90_04930 [Nitrospiraceae bacterium]